MSAHWRKFEMLACKVLVLFITTSVITAVFGPMAGQSQNLIVNGSFEVTTPPGASGYTMPFQANLATNGVPGWAFGSSQGDSYDGILQSGLLGPSGVIEDGTNCAFCQGTGWFSQTVSLSAGEYELSFYAMGRVDYGPAPVLVTLGNLFSETITPNNTSNDQLSDWILYTFFIAVTNAGSYTLEFAGTIPFSTRDTTTYIDNVSVLPETGTGPTIISQPSAQQILFAGQTAEFVVQASGIPPPSYQWQVESNGTYMNLINGDRISGATNATLIISNLDLGDSANYRVQVTNMAGATNSAVAVLTVDPAPPPGSPRTSVTIINPSFEDSQQSDDTYTTGYGTLDPQTGVPGWQFSSSGGDSYAGIVTESGTIMGTPKYIPQCWQAAFIQGTGYFSQSVTFKTAGTYVLRFRSEGRSDGGDGAETITTSIDGNSVGTFTPSTAGWSLFTSDPFTVTAGVHDLTFTGTVPFSTSDRTSFIDDVQIVTPAEAIGAIPPISPVYDIVFVGDSITFGATLSDPATQASAVRCMESLGQRYNMGIRMSNQGHSGHTTVDWLPSTNPSSDFQLAIAAAASLETNQPGQLIFSIMLGANDSAESGPDGAPVSPTNYLQNLQSIVGQFLANYPDAFVFVHYPTWYSTNTENGAVYLNVGLARLESYFPEIDQLISNCATLYPGHVFAGDKGLGFETFSNNFLVDMTPESGPLGTFYLHPNATGAVVLGSIWADAIAAPLNPTTNDSYVAWLQSCDMTPGTTGTGFGDTPTNASASNGVSYGNPNGLIVVPGASNSLSIIADIRDDANLTVVPQDSSDLINWNQVVWSVATNQSSVATGFIRYQIPQTSVFSQNHQYFRLVLSY
jgi:lysophospholipase L1-like esterase